MQLTSFFEISETLHEKKIKYVHQIKPYYLSYNSRPILIAYHELSNRKSSNIICAIKLGTVA